MRIINIMVSNTGQKKSVENNTMNQNSTDTYINLHTEMFYPSVTCTFKMPSGKLSADYHMLFKEFEPSTQTFLYEFNIPSAVSSFIMSAPTAKIGVSFNLRQSDINQYLKCTTVAETLITVNRSNNSDVIDASYNGADVNAMWDKLGELTNKLTDIISGELDISKGLPDDPIKDGTYRLVCNKTGNAIQYSWVKD